MIKDPKSFLLGILITSITFIAVLNYAIGKQKPYVCINNPNFNQTLCCKEVLRLSNGSLDCANGRVLVYNQ